MKFCPECGNPIEGCKFCPNCGYAVTNQPQPQPEQPKKPVQSKKTDKIGPLEIDRNNRTYRIHGAQKAKGSSGMVAGAVKVGLAMGTGGLSLIPSLIKKDKNDTGWYSFEDLVSYELIINNQAVVSGGVGQALIAGAMFGPIGAVAGGVVSKRKTTSKILNMTVRVTSNDFNKPVVFIDLIRKPVKNTSKEYKDAIENAQRIMGALDVIVHNS
jgi:LIM domain protein|nr:MAG TPA: zinc-ribbon domain protein [Caudoviricetes sp.]